jgi:hypothetical protein
MNKITKKILLVLILAIPVIFLSGCDDVDWDLLEDAFEAWAEENDLIENGEWKPEGLVIKAIDNTIADITNQEEFVQLDGLDVIRDIEKADQLAEEAMLELDPVKMEAAVSIRPLDWRLLEQEGAVWGANGDYASAEIAWTQSDELLRHSLDQGGDCAKLRRSQLEFRLGTLWEAVLTYESQEDRALAEAVTIREEHQLVREELQLLNINRSAFCDLHGND